MKARRSRGARKPATAMEWLETQLRDPEFRREVEQLLNRMRLEQDRQGLPRTKK